MPDAPLHVFTSEDAAQLRESEVHADVLQLRGGPVAVGVSHSSIVKPSLRPSLKSASSPGFDSSGW